MSDLSAKRNYIENLMAKLSFPEEAQKVFTEALDRISANPVAAAWFSSLLQQYDKSENCDYTQMFAHHKAMSEALGINEYTVAMVLLLCMAERLHSRYIERGIGEDVFLNTLSDLRYKLNECLSLHSVNGTFVDWWYPGFFKLTRFALGRLQFEVVFLGKDYTVGDTVLPAGSKAINIHIPQTGTRLDHNEVLKSYKLAAEMFADKFDTQPITFLCTSWLLDPWNTTVLPPKSNLMEFYNDFSIVDSGNYNDYNSTWLLFGCQWTGNTKDLPKDTSLRRAYAERIERGEPTAWGRGLFIYRDGEIINK